MAAQLKWAETSRKRKVTTYDSVQVFSDGNHVRLIDLTHIVEPVNQEGERGSVKYLLRFSLFDRFVFRCLAQLIATPEDQWPLPLQKACLVAPLRGDRFGPADLRINRTLARSPVIRSTDAYRCNVLSLSQRLQPPQAATADLIPHGNASAVLWQRKESLKQPASCATP